MKKTIQYPDPSMSHANKCSFILRLWRVNQSDTPDWRASVEIPETGKRIGFASLEQLFAFLINFTETDCKLPPMEDIKRR
ncbi:MAG TPA: hypothetical protein VLD65_06400 [Anaerolineales bacterium]|nr:hypothetical protein [Anaerolineales bacterium]